MTAVTSPHLLVGRAGTATVDPVDVGAALVTAALLAMVGLGLTGPVRVLLALGFVTFVPGWALLGLVTRPELAAGDPESDAARRPEDRGRVPLVHGMAKVAMAVAVSLTLCTLSAQAVLWLRLWGPSAMLAALGGLSLLALTARFVRSPAPLRPAPLPRGSVAGPS